MGIESTSGTGTKRRLAQNGSPQIKLKPVTEALRAALQGDLSVRVATQGLTGELADL